MIEIALFDKRIWPELGDEFCFRDRAPVLFDQQHQRLKRFRRQSDRLIVAQQLAFSRHEPERAEFISDVRLVGHTFFSMSSVVKTLAFSRKLHKNYKTNSRPFSYHLRLAIDAKTTATAFRRGF